MTCQIVIPARLASTRLPEKLLRRVGGKSVLRHTYDAACRSELASAVVVAVDDVRLADEVRSFGGQAVMTPTACPSGTDRVAYVARHTPGTDLFVNVQGDEPEIDPRTIDAVIAKLRSDGEADVATAVTPIRDPVLADDPHCVKVVADASGRAIYFSRAAIPFIRDRGPDDPPRLHHLGLYAYRREFLMWFASQPPSPLELAEKLEQLRAVEAGRRVVVAHVASATPGIDTEEDLRAFRRRVEPGGR